MGQIVNMTAYRFVDLPDRDDLRQPMLSKCLELDLKVEREIFSTALFSFYGFCYNDTPQSAAITGPTRTERAVPPQVVHLAPRAVAT